MPQSYDCRTRRWWGRYSVVVERQIGSPVLWIVVFVVATKMMFPTVLPPEFISTMLLVASWLPKLTVAPAEFGTMPGFQLAEHPNLSARLSPPLQS